jgi:hypothetical protein
VLIKKFMLCSAVCVTNMSMLDTSKHNETFGKLYNENKFFLQMRSEVNMIVIMKVTRNLMFFSLRKSLIITIDVYGHNFLRF